MTGLDSILEQELMHEDHIEALSDDFDCVDCFTDTEPSEDDLDNEDIDYIEDEEEYDYGL